VGCQFSDLPNGSSCDDGNPCTSSDSCLGGLCAPGPTVSCDDNNPCTVDTCDINGGGCVYNPLNQPCDDGKACTTGDICTNGVCEGVVQCDDGNPCTVDACDVFGQCSSASVGFGELCDDGDPCTSGDSCEQGACVGQPKDCDDGDPCTADLCDPFGQCQHESNTGKDCDDGNPCTEADLCTLLGKCQGVEKVCDDGDPCTADACDPAVGCTAPAAPDGTACDDGDACTENDACQAGQCDAGTPKSCDDGIACSDDTCKEGVCEHTASAQPGCCGKAAGPATLLSETFDLAEAAGWTFSNSKGAGKGWQVWLNPTNPPGPQSAPGVLYYGDPAAGNFAMDGTNNGKATSPLLQLPANAPQELTAKVYMNTESSSSYDRLYVRVLSNGQTSTLWQKPSGFTGSWKTLTLDLSAHAGKEVQLVFEFNTMDGVANTGLGVLIDDVVVADKGGGGAPGGGQVLCDDGNPCTDDLCDEQTWTCKATPVADATPCDDGKACTIDATCLAGQCIGTESCDDGNSCTLGGCGADGNCAFVPVPDQTGCDDGSVCTLDDACAAGECLGAALPCEDGNDCTADGCDPIDGCIFEPTDGAPCDDNNACTADDACAVDLCGGVTVVCDDDNACTTDSCDPAVGCEHVPLPEAATCDDGDGCTVNDACTAGQCVGGGPKDCDDGFACSDDSCVSGECQHVSTGAPGCCQPGGTLSWSEHFDAPLQGWSLNNSKGQGKGWQQLDPTFANPGAKSGSGTLYYGDPAAQNFSMGGSNNGTAASGAFALPAAAQGLKVSFAVYVDTESGSTYDKLELRVLDNGSSATVWTRPSGSSFQKKWQDVEVGLEAYAGKTISLQFSFNTVDGVGNSGLGVLIDDVIVGTGVIDGAVACDDGDPCTADACSDAFLCVNDAMADGSACDDGQACTADDTCLFGQCLGAESCDDGNSCTVGGCDFAGSCGFIDQPDGTACDDGNACTAPDVCAQALCGGAEVVCDDGDACTDDACDIATGCTATETDCSDGNACTADSCDSALGCEHTPVVNGLACDDGDACTLADACTEGTCTGGGAKDCDDQDPCTDDSCADGACVHTPNNGPGCCTPDVAAWSFDGQDATTLTISNSKGSGKGWQIWDQPKTPPGAQSAPGVLYYGDPAAGNFAMGGANNGKARTAAVQLPPGGNLSLQLKLYMDTESGTTYDRLFIHKYVDGAKQQVWSKGSGGFSTNKWLDINIDLSADAGKSVEIEFEFDTVDSVANSGLGVLIDDLKIAGDCAP
jgi:hypothetical protein